MRVSPTSLLNTGSRLVMYLRSGLEPTYRLSPETEAAVSRFFCI